MAYPIQEIELSRAWAPVVVGPTDAGTGLVLRFGGQLTGFVMAPREEAAQFGAEGWEALVDEQVARPMLAAKAEAELRARWPDPEPPTAPSLSIAICTKDRAPRLARLLRSLEVVRSGSPFSELEILVVDNAPSDDETRAAVAQFQGVRYVLEPRPGLDFARNAAVRGATGELLAFLDDDVVVDRGYLQGLHRAWRGAPEAGGFTGLVLPYRLDTPAQIHFESRGGFGRGFRRQQFRAERHGNALHPVGSGVLGAGCNMCFDRQLLLALGGFDEALDTGAPLPGGGDLDIFYRVLRSGRTMVYEPTYAVYHEHRESFAQLKRQYRTWGLGFMAFLTKCRRTDPALHGRHSAMLWWWTVNRLGAAGRAALRGRWRHAGFAFAELAGGVQGLLGEYDRSAARVDRIRQGAR